MALPVLPLALDPVASMDLVRLVEDGVLALVFLAAIGLALLVQFRMFETVFRVDDGAPPANATNCPACGARTTTDAAACPYCEEPLPV